MSHFKSNGLKPAFLSLPIGVTALAIPIKYNFFFTLRLVRNSPAQYAGFEMKYFISHFHFLGIMIARIGV